MDAQAPQSDERLLRSLAEQLKIPLTLIARQSELAASDSLQTIHAHSKDAIRLIEAYLLAGYLHGQQQLQLEPVSIKALLYDVAHELEPKAKQHSTKLELTHKGRFGLVMAHAGALRYALTLLGVATLDQISDNNAPQVVNFRAYSYEGKIQAGVYGQSHLTSEDLQVGKELFGSAHQATPHASSSPSTELYLADALLRTMHTSVHVSHHKEQTGLVTSLFPSQQLSLLNA